MKNKTTGLVLGKFMPLHKGHELLLGFATCFVETLYIVVDNIVDAPISGELRCSWIQSVFPNAEVFYIPTPLPQHPDEASDFWAIWSRSLVTILPKKPDYVFASETYGFKLAEVLQATFIPFDFQREQVPVSGELIRENPWAYWDYLSAPARLFYLKRICLFGPESTGKTTLAQALASHYQTRWVPEYARMLIESNNTLHKEDIILIAKGQCALEDAIAPMANKRLFCDTDVLATMLWSKWLYQSCPKEVEALAYKKTYDLYLLMSPDLEWIPDQARYFPEKRQEFFDNCREMLEVNKRPYVVITGTGNDRLQCAIQAIESS